MKKIVGILCFSLIMLICVNTMAAVISMDVPVYESEDVVTVDIKLDSIPEDIDSISAITIRYDFDRTKLEYVSTEYERAEFSNALFNAGNIIWYDETMDASKALTSEKLAENNNVLFTLKFCKVSGFEGDANIDFKFVELSSPAPEFTISTKTNTQGTAVNFADYEAAKLVTEAIVSLGEARYTKDFQNALYAVEESYAALTENQKKLVSNYSDYQELKAAYEKMDADVKSVIAAIEAIGEVEHSGECFEKIVIAEELYNSLESDELKAAVTNYAVLVEARLKYDELAPEIREFNELPGYNGNHMVVVLGVADDKIVIFHGKTAQIVKIGSEVYHVLATEEDIDVNQIEIKESSIAEPVKQQVVGSVIHNNADRITATDANVVNSYVAGLATGTFDNDPMAFIRADVSGDGVLSALDALMIAYMAMYDEVDYKVNVRIYLGDFE